MKTRFAAFLVASLLFYSVMILLIALNPHSQSALQLPHLVRNASSSTCLVFQPKVGFFIQMQDTTQYPRLIFSKLRIVMVPIVRVEVCLLWLWRVFFFILSATVWMNWARLMIGVLPTLNSSTLNSITAFAWLASTVWDPTEAFYVFDIHCHDLMFFLFWRLPAKFLSSVRTSVISARLKCWLRLPHCRDCPASRSYPANTEHCSSPPEGDV